MIMWLPFKPCIIFVSCLSSLVARFVTWVHPCPSHPVRGPPRAALLDPFRHLAHVERGELADVDVGADLAQGLEALGPASGQTNAPWRIASTGPRGRLPARARGCRRAASSSRRRGAALSIPIHWRFRFLVASPPVPDLLLCAKHLFVAAGPWGVHITSVGPAKVQKCTDGSA